MDFLYYVVSFVFVITVVVFFHELGHYLAAKRCGVKVVKFSIGMGPELFGFTDKNETRWSFSLIPVGGYVMMLGDDDISSSQANIETIKKLSEEDKKKTLQSKSNLEKMWISFCGPFANYIYSFVVMCGVFLFFGIPQSTAEISMVMPNSPAQEAGILAGDVVLSINDIKIKKYQQIPAIINSSNSEYLDCIVNRNGEEKKFKLKPTTKEEVTVLGKTKSHRQMGVMFGSTKYEKVSIMTAIDKSFSECVNATVAMFSVFKKLFSDKSTVNNLGGFIQMASISGEIFKNGNFVSLLMFSVTLALNLGFINLLPLPVLDGGNIVISFIEQVIRKPINKKVMSAILSFGVVILVLLMLFTTINDLLRLEFVKKILSCFL